MVKLPFKLLAFATVPAAVALILSYIFITNETKALSDQALSTIEHFLMDAKKRELRNYSSITQTAISHIYDPADPNNVVAQNLVAEILEEIEYDGDDGYFFVYDEFGKSIAHPKQPFRVGNNYWELEDPGGEKIIQILIANAKKGGDFYRYPWDKPSLQTQTEKISYSFFLDKWKWMVGTGIYIDDIQKQLNTVQADIDTHIRNTEEIILVIALLTTLSIFLAGIYVTVIEKNESTVQLDKLSQRIVNLQEEERRRISREMHDGIVQILVSIKYSLAATKMGLSKLGESAPKEMEQATDNLDSAIQEIRRISHDLHPRILDELGLGLALDSMTKEFTERTGIRVDLIRPAVKKVLPDEIATTMYRVVQESLTNIEKHSQATSCVVNLYFTSSGLVLEITDNGTGFDKQNPSALTEGIGIRNLTERLEYQGGSFKLSSSSEGTTVTAKIPGRLFKPPQQLKALA